MYKTISTPRLVLAVSFAMTLSGCVVAVATGQIEAPYDDSAEGDTPGPAMTEVDASTVVLMDAGDDPGELTPIDYPSPTGP